MRKMTIWLSNFPISFQHHIYKAYIDHEVVLCLKLLEEYYDMYSIFSVYNIVGILGNWNFILNSFIYSDKKKLRSLFTFVA